MNRISELANAKRKTGTISIKTAAQSTRRVLCELSLTPDENGQDFIECEGQTEAHAIALALEKLAGRYRKMAEAAQNLDWDAVARSPEGEAMAKRYHVTVHYESQMEKVSKLEAMHSVLMGNTVVENAEITVIEVDAGLKIEEEDQIV